MGNSGASATAAAWGDRGSRIREEDAVHVLRRSQGVTHGDTSPSPSASFAHTRRLKKGAARPSRPSAPPTRAQRGRKQSGPCDPPSGSRPGRRRSGRSRSWPGSPAFLALTSPASHSAASVGSHWRGGPTLRTFRSDMGSYHIKRMVQKLCIRGTICSSKQIETSNSFI